MSRRRLATAAVLLVAAGLAGLLLSGCGGEDDTALANYEETLPDMVEDFGDDARVLSIVVKPDTTTYEVVRDGTVLIRTYDVKSSTKNVNAGPNQRSHQVKSRGRYESDSKREPTREELKRPGVTLGELDPGVVDAMLAESGGNFTTTSTLTGRTWVLIPPGISAGHEANFDGTGLRSR